MPNKPLKQDALQAARRLAAALGVMASASLSTTRQAIADVSRDHCRPLLKLHGFKTRGRGFWRETDGLLHDIAFQASMWGTAASGQFTINVGVTHPQMYALFVHRAVPKNPSSAHWPISQRIGFLLPEKRDKWWSVDETTDVPTLGQEIARALETAALPFLDSLRNRQQFGAYLDAGYWVGIPDLQIQLARGLLMYCNGERQQALDTLSATLELVSGKPGESMIRMALEELQSRGNDA